MYPIPPSPLPLSVSLSLSLPRARTCGRLMARARPRLRGRAQPAISRLRDICEIQPRRTENTPPGGEEGRGFPASKRGSRDRPSESRWIPAGRACRRVVGERFRYEERALERATCWKLCCALFPSLGARKLTSTVTSAPFKELTGYVRRPVARAGQTLTERRVRINEFGDPDVLPREGRG